MLAWLVRILTFIACMGLLQCHKPDKGNATCDSTALLQRRKQRMLEAESDGQNQTKGSAFSKWYSYQWHSRRRSRHYGASGAISRLHREIDSLQRRIGGSANRLDDQIVDLESTLYNLTENLNAQTTELERKIESPPVSPRESNVPISIFDGFCDPGAAKLPPESTCNQSDVTANAPCEFTISNQIDRASSNGRILPGCPFLKDTYQELFMYCNDGSFERLVTATTCNGLGTANFPHQLAVYENLTALCKVVACNNNLGSAARYPCADAWQGDGPDLRATVKFRAPPNTCFYIVQQSAGGMGNETDTLMLKSAAAAPGGGLQGASLLSVAQSQEAGQAGKVPPKSRARRAWEGNQHCFAKSLLTIIYRPT